MCICHMHIQKGHAYTTHMRPFKFKMLCMLLNVSMFDPFFFVFKKLFNSGH